MGISADAEVRIAVMISRALEDDMPSGEHIGSNSMLAGLERIAARAVASLGSGLRRRRGKAGE